MVCARAARLTLVGCTVSVRVCVWARSRNVRRATFDTWQRSRSCGRARVCDDARAVACAEKQVSALGMVAVGFQRANKRSGFDTGSPGALALVNDRPVRSGRFAASRVSPSLALGTLETPALPRCALRLRVTPCRAAARASLSRARTVLSPSRFHAATTAAARDRAPFSLVFSRREQCVGSD